MTDDDRNSNETDAYFVLEGRCTCVQRLYVRKTTIFGRHRFTLVQNRSGDRGSDEKPFGENIQTAYVKMSDLQPGSVFGLGKNYINVFVQEK